MFFVRTQRENAWQIPAYRFNNRQRNAFQRMVAAAQQQVASEEVDSDSDSDGEGEEDYDTENEEGTGSESSRPMERQKISLYNTTRPSSDH